MSAKLTQGAAELKEACSSLTTAFEHLRDAQDAFAEMVVGKLSGAVFSAASQHKSLLILQQRLAEKR